MKSQIQKEKAKRRLLEKEYRRIKKKIRSITVWGLMGAPGIARNQMGLLGLLSLMEASLV
jgi:hypothetical protein